MKTYNLSWYKNKGGNEQKLKFSTGGQLGLIFVGWTSRAKQSCLLRCVGIVFVGTLLSVVFFFHFRCFLFVDNQALASMSSRAELICLSPFRRYKASKNARSPSVPNRCTPPKKHNALNFSVDYPSSEPESDSADSDSELSDISKSSEVVYVVSPKRKEKNNAKPRLPMRWLSTKSARLLCVGYVIVLRFWIWWWWQ